MSLLPFSNSLFICLIVSFICRVAAFLLSVFCFLFCVFVFVFRSCCIFHSLYSCFIYSLSLFYKYKYILDNTLCFKIYFKLYTSFVFLLMQGFIRVIYANLKTILTEVNSFFLLFLYGIKGINWRYKINFWFLDRNGLHRLTWAYIKRYLI